MNKSIAIEIKKIDNLILRKLITFSKEFTDIQLSPVQIVILKYLNDNKDKIIHQKDIEDFIQNRKSTISTILDTMQKNNLIIKINSKSDARSKEIVLTNDAIVLCNKIKEHDNYFQNLLSRNIDNEDLNVFYKVLNQIKLNLKGEEK